MDKVFPEEVVTGAHLPDARGRICGGMQDHRGHHHHRHSHHYHHKMINSIVVVVNIIVTIIKILVIVIIIIVILILKLSLLSAHFLCWLPPNMPGHAISSSRR